MRISDWSSDVCSSDLTPTRAMSQTTHPDGRVELVDPSRITASPLYNHDLAQVPVAERRWTTYNYAAPWIRSEERRVGNECVSTCISRRWLDHEKNNESSIILRTREIRQRRNYR